jgi:hypothetical protein
MRVRGIHFLCDSRPIVAGLAGLEQTPACYQWLAKVMSMRLAHLALVPPGAADQRGGIAGDPFRLDPRAFDDVDELPWEETLSWPWRNRCR